MLDGSTIAAILTGVLALVGAIATAWMSGWNEQRLQARKNRRVLARYSVPLLIAAWDLANWFYDITEKENYNIRRCNAYGNGWRDEFTSYLLGQYFAGVHIIREMTQFFAYMKGERADALKKLLWKIQDEFVSMNHEGHESLPMRWFEGDILAAQERLTTAADLDGDGNAGELRTVGWVDFLKSYNSPSGELKALFGTYEVQFQKIIYRRFMRLYSTEPKFNPQDIPISSDHLQNAKIEEEQHTDPNVGIIVPDHRVRRLQHLLSDLVELLDQVSTMEFNRPVRRCTMLAENRVVASGNPLGLETGIRIPCDCYHVDCNPKKKDFEHRQLVGRKDLLGRAKSFLPDGETSIDPGASTFQNEDTEKYAGTRAHGKVVPELGTTSFNGEKMSWAGNHTSGRTIG